MLYRQLQEREDSGKGRDPEASSDEEDAADDGEGAS